MRLYVSSSLYTQTARTIEWRKLWNWNWHGIELELFVDFCEWCLVNKALTTMPKKSANKGDFELNWNYSFYYISLVLVEIVFLCIKHHSNYCDAYAHCRGGSLRKCVYYLILLYADNLRGEVLFSKEILRFFLYECGLRKLSNQPILLMEVWKCSTYAYDSNWALKLNEDLEISVFHHNWSFSQTIDFIYKE